MLQCLLLALFLKYVEEKREKRKKEILLHIKK
jgi:hypothetical protein